MSKKIVSIFHILVISSVILSAHYSIADESSTISMSHHIKEVSLPSYYYNLVDNDDLTILYPRSTIPAFGIPNQEVMIQFQSITFDTVTASIETAYDPLPDTFSLSIESIEQIDKGYVMYALVPNDTPEELYNLTVSIVSEGQTFTQTRPRSISVKQRIDGNFSFVQLADFHIGDPRGLTENPKEIFGWKASRKVISEVNLINPDFVIISGDLTFGQLFPLEYIYEYRKCYEIIQEFQVPTFLAPGNHDGYVQTGQDGFMFWEQYFGPLYYSFNFGDHHFVSVNSYDWSKMARIGFSYLVFNWGGSIQSEQLNWIEQDLKDNQDMKICINLHHNPLWDTTSDSLLRNPYHHRDEFLSLIQQYQVDAVFAGHVHYDNVSMHNGTMFITTTTVSSGIDDEQGYWGYRKIDVENNEFVSINYKQPRYSIPSYRLNYSYVTDKHVVIENDLEKELSVEVEFVTSVDDYEVNIGDIVQIRKKDDMAAYYVSANIAPHTEQAIILQ